MSRFQDKIAVVTGGAGGIGTAITERLASEGAHVIAIDNNIEWLETLGKRLEDKGLQAQLVALDCVDYDAVIAKFAEFEAEHGRIDVLVNNIGVSARDRAKEFYEQTPDVWDHVINVSLRTTMNCSRAVAPGMRERKYGKIVNISSETATYGDFKGGEYAAAKAGVLGLTKVLARELGPYGVSVNAISPGVINTHAIHKVPPEVLQTALAAIPRGKICEPEDLAAVVAFLAADESQGILGQTILVNGGRTMN